jgi:hypothetical protein
MISSALFDDSKIAQAQLREHDRNPTAARLRVPASL